MSHDSADDVRIVISEAALAEIFDECDRYERDETGGRVLGTFTADGRKLTLHVTGIIEPGPLARRSPTSFFQDGEHQERIFRQIEDHHPEIEHLGNWHTHHVNGLKTLSGGDLQTYRRVVNHAKHNTPFFYALLVTEKHAIRSSKTRYNVKHFLFRRDDERVYEIPASHVSIVHTPLVWPAGDKENKSAERKKLPSSTATPSRVLDRDILGDFYPGIRSFASPKLGVYWRGPLQLLDGSQVEVVVIEDDAGGNPRYSVSIRKPPTFLESAADNLSSEEFSSARAALVSTERICNRALFEHRDGK